MSRKAFEEYAKTNNRLNGYAVSYHPVHGYPLRETQTAWEAWQACAEEKDKRIAELEALLIRDLKE